MLKNIFKTLLALTISLALIFNQTHAQTPEELRNQIIQREKEIQELEKQAEAYRDEIDKNSSKAKTLNTEISRINAQVNQIRNNIAITEKKIEATTLEIQELGLDITGAENAIQTNKEVLAELLRQLYEMDSKDPLTLILEQNEVSDIVQQFAYLDSLQSSLIEKTNFLRDLKGNLEISLDTTEKKKQQYDTLSKTLSVQKTAADGQRQEKQTVLTQTKNQEATYQKLLTETEQKQKQVEAEIISMEQELRKQLNLDTLPDQKKGLFIWPVQGGYLTQGYGSVPVGSVTRRYYSFHNGIDIGAKTGAGTPIIAAADGKVRAVGDNGKMAYGVWAAIDHGNNLVTLYAHMTRGSVLVKPGQAVKKGQVIGLMGTTGLVTGPHLHFTVYATDTFITTNQWYGLLPAGAHLNPNDYL